MTAAGALTGWAVLRPGRGEAVRPQLPRRGSRRPTWPSPATLPRAAGLSSSSALVVAVGHGRSRAAPSCTRATSGSAEIGSVEDLAWYLGCVENGLDYRGLAGTAGVGTLGGSEDHTAILACRVGRLSQYRFVPVAHQGDVPMPPSLDLRHRVERRARGQGWLRARSLQPCLARAPGRCCTAGTRRRRVRPARSARLWPRTARCPGSTSSIATRPPAGYTPAALAARLSHFVAEDGRVPEAARAFALGDAGHSDASRDDSQREADEWLGNQTPETRALAAAASDVGALRPAASARALAAASGRSRHRAMRAPWPTRGLPTTRAAALRSRASNGLSRVPARP